MPVYKENAATDIVVPNSSGVLSDDQYGSLSPNAYRLDEVLNQFSEIREKVKKRLEEFSILYEEKAVEVEENLGTNFFSINNQPLGVVDSLAEIKKESKLTDELLSELDNSINHINNINKKLDEVEQALRSMNEQYHERKNEISTFRNQYSSYVQTEPQEYQYTNKYDYVLAHTSWGQQVRYFFDQIDEKERLLKEDCEKTKNRIVVSWYCSEKGG